MQQVAKQTCRYAERSQIDRYFHDDGTLVITRRDRFPIRITCPSVQLLLPHCNTYPVSAVIFTPSGNELVYAWPGLHFVCFDRDFHGVGREKAVAWVGRRGGKQRHHLLHRDADGTIRFRPREPVLHGPLRKQSLELAMQEALATKQKELTKLPIGTWALALALCALSGALLGAQSTPLTRRPVRHLVTPSYPDLARKLNLTGTARIEVTIGPDGSVKHTRVLGGHPVLAAEAERAAEKSTFEPASAETVEVIEFKF
jgi:TonB family protein